MRQLLLAFFLLSCISVFSQNIAPDFSLTDTDGVTHNLYEDYLDQGKTVFIYVGAVWAPFDKGFLEQNILQDFQNEYVPSGNSVVLLIDPNSPTIDDLMGTGPFNETGFDYLSACNFPVISTDTTFSANYNIAWFPSIRMVCPDRSLHGDDVSPPGQGNDLFYAELESAEYIAEKMYEYCGTEFDLASIDGQVFFDEDSDCTLGANENTNLVDFKAIVDGPTGTFTKYSKPDGSLRMVARVGDYTINVCPPNDLWSVCNNPQTVTISSTDQKEEIDFGLQVGVGCSRMEAQITSPFLRRCFSSQVFVDYCNAGTLTAEDAFVEVELDQYMIFDSSIPVPTSVNGSTLRYELGDVPIFECDRIRITVEMSCDTVLGVEQCYTVTYGPSENCDNKTQNSDTECQEIRGAYDPNDKRAFPLSGGDEYTILPNEEIKYQIRFQNTGTDTAFNIVVEDVLSPYLDLNTFRLGQSSHPYTVEIDERRKAIFKFDNIMLPDSFVNVAGSNGFLNYYITQKADLLNGTHITNEAAIYFDFNDPIWTNRTDHTVDDNSSVKESDDNSIRFSMNPNPAFDQLRIEIASKEWMKGTVDILDLNGKKLLTEDLNQEALLLDVSSLDSGLYLVHLRDQDNRCATKKLTILK